MVAGATEVEQVRRNVAALTTSNFADDELAAIDALTLEPAT